jgi:hypothetical protein
MSTPTPPPGLPPKPPLTLTPRVPQATPPAAPAAEPPELPTFRTAGIPLATALLRLGLPVLVVVAVVVFSLFSSTIGLILGSAVLLAGVVAVVLPAIRGRSGMRRPGRRQGGGRLGRLLSGGRPGGLRSRAASALGRARNGRFASRLRGLAGGRPSRSGGSRPGAGGRPGAFRASRLLAKGRSLLTSRRPGGSRAGGRPGGRPEGRAGGGRPGGLGRFLPRRASGARAAHGSTRRPGGRAPGKGGSKGAGNTSPRGASLLGKLTGGRLGRPGSGGRKPSGGSGGKRPGGTRPGSSGAPRGKGKGGKGKPSDWGTGTVEVVTFGLVRGVIGLGRFVGNRVRSVDPGAVADALKAPFAPGPPTPFTAGIDDDTKSDPVPDSWPGMSAADHEWPDDDDHPGASKASDYAWPRDRDRKPPPDPPSHVSPHVSSHTPDQHESPKKKKKKGKPVSTNSAKTTTTAPTAAEYAGYLDKSTPGTQAEKLDTAATAASTDADQQDAEAEEFRAKARRLDGFKGMEDQAEEFRSEARKLDEQASARRVIATEFRNAASEKATA